ncbi:membrane dipeptidase, partial [candidate division KSB1 bacterium]|nr:membrane dipeptidase [candidate division KSB1 bacterium]
MNSRKTLLPVFDLHCDLLAYLAENTERSPLDTDEIGCALPFLQEGNVKLQVLAIYSPVEVGSSKFASEQGRIYGEILNNYDTYLTSVQDLDDLDGLIDGEKTGVVLAIENAAGFCEEADSLKDGFKKLDNIAENMGPILYIS